MPVSDAPLAAASAFTDIGRQISAFLAVARIKAADGITWQEFGQLMVALMRLGVSTLDSVLTLTGAQKKVLVLEAVAVLFDTLAGRCVPIVTYPAFMAVRPALRALILAIASGAIEALIPLVRSST
jgi:hypothetical protein